MRIVNWNLARHAPDAWQGVELTSRIKAARPDLLCVTEAHTHSLNELGGHVLTDRGVLWGEEIETECKVALWSANEWTDETPLPGLSELGGAIFARTISPLGPLQVVAVCMPYNMAWPKNAGFDSRPEPWSQHLAFLERLKPVLAGLDKDIPAVVLGDFNQFLPLNWGSWEAHHALNDTLGGLQIVTSGAIEPVGEQTVDHVAISHQLRAASIEGLTRYTDDDRAFSDHFGIVVRLEAGGVRLVD